jgi:hypothetical protein
MAHVFNNTIVVQEGEIISRAEIVYDTGDGYHFRYVLPLNGVKTKWAPKSLCWKPADKSPNEKIKGKTLDKVE